MWKITEPISPVTVPKTMLRMIFPGPTLYCECDGNGGLMDVFTQPSMALQCYVQKWTSGWNANDSLASEKEV